jgi:cytochrome P450
MGQDIVIANSVEVVSALFGQKGQVCSNRPRFTFGSELVGWKDFMTHFDDGPALREQRRLMAQEIGSKVALDRFSPMMEAKAREFICSVLDDPSSEALLPHIRA